jgi:hypothetical protein
MLAFVILCAKRIFFCAALYCPLWPLWLHHIFPHYLTTGTIIGKKKKKMTEHKMCVLIFSTTFA